MRVGFAIALMSVTACYADGALAPERLAPVVTTVRPIVSSMPYTLEIDGEIVPNGSLRLAQLNAADIETIEVIKGTDASQLYPTHPCPAIIITTKHAAHSTTR